MKKLIAIFLILSVAVVLAGCSKKTEDNTSDQSKTVENTEPKDTQNIDLKNEKTETSNAELDLTEQDLKQLKSDIQNIQVEDLSGLSE